MSVEPAALLQLSVEETLLLLRRIEAVFERLTHTPIICLRRACRQAGRAMHPPLKSRGFLASFCKVQHAALSALTRSISLASLLLSCYHTNLGPIDERHNEADGAWSQSIKDPESSRCWTQGRYYEKAPRIGFEPVTLRLASCINLEFKRLYAVFMRFRAS
jgi:hypothetical protein